MSRTSIERIYKDFIIRRNQSLNDIRCTEAREITVIKQHFRKLKIKIPKEVSNVSMSTLIDHGLRVVFKDDNIFLEIPSQIIMNGNGAYQFDDYSTLLSSAKPQLQSTFLGTSSHVKPFSVDISTISPAISIEKFIKERNSSLVKLEEKRDKLVREIREYFTCIENGIPEVLLSKKMADLEIVPDTGENKR